MMAELWMYVQLQSCFKKTDVCVGEERSQITNKAASHEIGGKNHGDHFI